MTRCTRILALLAVVALVPPAQADQLLPQGRITTGNDILFGALRLGKRVGGRTTLTPDAIEGDASAVSVAPQGFGATSASLARLLGDAMPRVATLAALKAVGLPYARIRRDGFAAAGDGGAVDYTWSGSNCTTPDDGAQVQPAGRTGCWIADFGSANPDVRVWGARQGQNIEAPLRAAIAYACKTHAHLVLPYAFEGGQYLIGSQINIGNGSAAAYSTCNNVGLEMVGAYAGSTSGTFPPLGMAIRWTGPTNDGQAMFNVQGPIKGVRFKGFSLACDFKCATGLRVSNALDSNFEYLSVEHQNGPAFVVTSETENQLFSSTEGTKFYKIHGEFPGAGGSGMQIGSVTCTTCNYGVLGVIFEDIVFNYDGNTPSAYGFNFGLASQNLLINIRTTPFFVGGNMPGQKGYALKITPPPGRKDFPTNNTFLNPLIAGPVDPGPDASGWAPLFGGFNFVGWSTVYQPFPASTVSGRFTGSDSWGGVFAGAPQAWTPVDASGTGLTLNVQEAQFTKIGKVCTVIFAITYPATTNTAAAKLGGLPCAAQFGSGTARAGGAPSYTTVGSPFTILLDSGLTDANFYGYDGSGIVNSSLSGKTIRASLTYITD